LASTALLPGERQAPVEEHAVHTAAPPLLNVPTGQGSAALAATGQKEPAGHDVPMGVAAPCAQKVPAAQGFAVAEVLPVAVQKPAAQGVQEEAPAAENVPAAQGLVVPAVCAAPHQ